MLVTKRFLVLLLAGTALLALGVQYVWFYDLLMALLWLADYSAGRRCSSPWSAKRGNHCSRPVVHRSLDGGQHRQTSLTDHAPGQVPAALHDRVRSWRMVGLRRR